MLRLTSVVALAVCGCGGSLAQPTTMREDAGWDRDVGRPPDLADSAARLDASTGCGESGACGPVGSSDCCATGNVAGGSFFRDYDGVDNIDKSHFANVSSFAFDRYEVTVGRFRPFVAATVSGWKPSSGSGKHTHLNGGKGLLSASGRGFESGWDATWDSSVPASVTSWAQYWTCSEQTWSPSSSASNLPINCVDWYVAYAFCIWDGGFLPSETEWNYAASAGVQQRVYPWSSPPTSTELDCAHANAIVEGKGCATSPEPAGSHSPSGDGLWGQADLAGNLKEWTLDWASQDVATCVDCANVADNSFMVRAMRGGAYDLVDSRVADPDVGAPSDQLEDFGFRCARTP